MFLDILSSLSLVVVINLHQNRKTQEKVLKKKVLDLYSLGVFLVAYLNCCLLFQGNFKLSVKKIVSAHLQRTVQLISFFKLQVCLP